MRVLEKSKISRAEENKQSQCVEGCDWSMEAGDLMPASDWSRGEETRPATTQRRGIDPARRCQLCQARRGRIGNILRFLTLMQSYPLHMFAPRHVLHQVLHLVRFLSRVTVYTSALPLPGLLPSARLCDPEYTSACRLQSIQLQSCSCTAGRERPVRPKPF